MKIARTALYRFHELEVKYQQQARAEYICSFLSRTTPLNEIWFTVTGLIYPIFNV